MSRYKARMVVKGHMQGIIDGTYAPVVDFTTVRVALSIAVMRGYHIHQMDVATAFLHGDVDEEIYITSPGGISLCKPSQMLPLYKGLYPLKQAPRMWNIKWGSVLKAMGFSQMRSDKFVFKREGIWILLYVDNMIIMGMDESELLTVKKGIAEFVEVTDLGELEFFLDASLRREGTKAWLSQSHHVSQILKRFGLHKCKPVCAPMVAGVDLSSTEDALVSQRDYQEIAGALLYLSTRIRPDISAAVGILCRYSAKRRNQNLTGLKRILQYSWGTQDFGLCISEVDELRVFSDSNWAREIED